MSKLAMIGSDIAKAQSLLEKGDIVAIPTETVYGLAANAYDLSALQKIFSIKGRPYTRPLTLQTSSIEKVQSLVKKFPSKAQQLARVFWPGPLTLVLEKQAHIPDLATAGLTTVGIRIPNHPLTLSLLQKLHFPLAVPSANISGYRSLTTAASVHDQFGKKIAYILDGGPCQLGIESTVISFGDPLPTLYRVGYISRETIAKVIGPIQLRHIQA